MNLSTLLSKRAAAYPRNICVKYDSAKLTYPELDRLVSHTSGGMQKMGLKVNDRAAILMGNCPEYIISYFAIIRAGGVAIPVNTFLTAHEVAYVLKDAGCRFMIYGHDYADHAKTLMDAIPGLQATAFEDIPQETGESRPGGADDVAVLLYTSGTTGFPKGVMLTHRNLISNVEACCMVTGFSEKDRVLLFLPLFHSFSFTVCVLVPLYSGGRIVLLESVRPFSKVVNSIIKDRITFFIAVPTVYTILSRKRLPFFVKFLFRFLVRIRICVSGAAALPEATLSAFEQRFQIPLLEGYGLTEASPVVTFNPLHKERKARSVGLPLPGITVAVVDEQGRRKNTGESGELIVKGPNVMKGYYGKQEETASVLKDGWLYTGDMASIDSDGYIYILDRKKDLIIVDGMNISPREVEDLVAQDPSVEECSMVGIPDERGSEVSVLFVKKKEHALLDEDKIKNHLKRHVARFKIPKRVLFIQDFPKTPTGKIKKTELRKWKI